MKIPYYPGCTLNTNAKDLQECAEFSAEALGFSMVEMADWNCCGASLPLTANSAMGYAGPTNVLIAGKEAGLKEGLEDKLVTLCAVCYNVLKRTNYAFNKDAGKLDTINSLLEKDYKGDTNVVHFLEVLRDDIGFDQAANVVDASDLATALTLVNALKQALIDNNIMLDASASS